MYGKRPIAIHGLMSHTTIASRAVGYIRVSTEEQASSGAGLRAQREEVGRECERRDWELLRVYSDSASGKSLAGRHGLRRALEVLDAGEADVLVASKLDRISRSIVDFGQLVERSRKGGWTLVALDLGVDTSTPSGELVANVMVSVAQWERRAIGLRTREALAVKRAEGVRLGRPPLVSGALAKRIIRRRREGQSYRAIADWLNSSGVPTAHGGARWHAATVRGVALRSSSDEA